MLIDVATDQGTVWINPAQVLRVTDIPGTEDCDLVLIVGDSLTVRLSARQLVEKINDFAKKAGK